MAVRASVGSLAATPAAAATAGASWGSPAPCTPCPRCTDTPTPPPGGQHTTCTPGTAPARRAPTTWSLTRTAPELAPRRPRPAEACPRSAEAAGVAPVPKDWAGEARGHGEWCCCTCRPTARFRPWRMRGTCRKGSSPWATTLSPRRSRPAAAAAASVPGPDPKCAPCTPCRRWSGTCTPRPACSRSTGGKGTTTTILAFS